MKYLALGLILAGLTLTACGQKGPLYLPQPETPSESTQSDASAS